jgi:hypothetical protein
MNEPGRRITTPETNKHKIHTHTFTPPKRLSHAPRPQSTSRHSYSQRPQPNSTTVYPQPETKAGPRQTLHVNSHIHSLRDSSTPVLRLAVRANHRRIPLPPTTFALRRAIHPEQNPGPQNPRPTHRTPDATPFTAQRATLTPHNAEPEYTPQHPPYLPHTTPSPARTNTPSRQKSPLALIPRLLGLAPPTTLPSTDPQAHRTQRFPHPKNSLQMHCKSRTLTPNLSCPS